MAKKRVHEIAKERGISSKEVLSALQAAGLEVKAAASSVDEGDIRRAFDGGGGTAAPGNGDGAATRPRAPAADEGAAAQPTASTRPGADAPQARDGASQRPARPTRPDG